MRKYNNPVIMFDENEYGRRSDPYILKYDGMYYHCIIGNCAKRKSVI